MDFPVYFPDTADLPLPPGHRFPAAKYRMLRETVLAQSILTPARLFASPPAATSDLGRAHGAAYIAAVRDGSLDDAAVRRLGLPWSQVLVARALATVGGTLAAARAALTLGIAGQLAGGTHHAHRDSGAGFCVFNDCAVAALALIGERQVGRVAVLDLDVHQGDGNAAILAPEPAVFVASVHGQNNYPFIKPASDLDIGLPDGTQDGAYLAACDRAREAVLGFAPGLVLYIAGVDPLACDRLGRLDVSAAGLFERDRAVFAACRAMGVPVAVLSGGGYGDPITDTVAAYANTYRAARAVFG